MLRFIIPFLLLLLMACGENHEHDGIYKMYFLDTLTITLKGNTRLSEHPFGGNTKGKCKQSEKDVEFYESDGKTTVWVVQPNGDLKCGFFHLQKIKE